MTPLLALSQTAINFTYLVAAVLLIVGIRRLSSPPTARSGNWIAAVGMGIAIFFTFLDEDITSYWLIVVGMADRDGDRGRLGATREDDRDAADGGALQRRRRRSGGAHRGRRVSPDRACGRPPLRRLGRGDALLGADRLDLLLGQPGRLRQAAGGPARPPDHLHGPAGRERPPLRRAARARSRCRLDRAGDLDGAAPPGSPALRRPPRPSDRRRRHAGRHLAPERIHGSRRRLGRLRAREHGAHHRRDARRRLGHAPHRPHGPGDEPLDRQRPLRRVRGGAGRRALRQRPRPTGSPTAR